MCTSPWAFSVSALRSVSSSRFTSSSSSLLLFLLPLLFNCSNHFNNTLSSTTYIYTHTLHSPPLLSSSHFRLYHSTNAPLHLPLSSLFLVSSHSHCLHVYSPIPLPPLLLSLRLFIIHSQTSTSSQRPFFHSVSFITLTFYLVFCFPSFPSSNTCKSRHPYHTSTK